MKITELGEMVPNFDASAPPTFVTEFSNELESLNIKLVATYSVSSLFENSVTKVGGGN